MKKKIGKQRLPVVINSIYSQLIFSVASGMNYPQKIYKIHKKKAVSVIFTQLKLLEKEGYLTSKKIENKSKFPMQRLRIYSVNWSKIIEEFLKEVREHRDTTLKQLRKEELEELREEIKIKFGENLNILFELDKKDFIERLKKNKYLIEYFKLLFKNFGKIKGEYTLSNIFNFIILFGSFEFVDIFNAVDLNLTTVFSLISESKEKTKLKIEKTRKNQELKNLSQLNKIIQITKINPLFRKIMNISERWVSIKILSEYLNKKELEELRHKNKMEEIEAEKQAKLEVEKAKFDYQLSIHRLKRADIKRTIQERAYLLDKKD